MYFFYYFFCKITYMKDLKIQAVIFDMDGVLLDTEYITKICWKKAAEEYGINGIEEVPVYFVD